MHLNYLEKIYQKDRLFIKIVPIGNVSQEVLNRISNSLNEAFPSIIDETGIESKLEIPSGAYNKERDQYRASEILEYVAENKNIPKNVKCLAVTPADLFNNGLNFVFGQARRYGKISIISLPRLKPEFYGGKRNRALFLERVAKEAIHEVGHTFGLGHCSNSECVMSFSNDINAVDRKERSLCKTCQRSLGL